LLRKSLGKIASHAKNPWENSALRHKALFAEANAEGIISKGKSKGDDLLSPTQKG
jgi:hypothetical protein